MDVFKADVAIVGAGGAGLRAAIAVAEADPSLTVALISEGLPDAKPYRRRRRRIRRRGAGERQPATSFRRHRYRRRLAVRAGRRRLFRRPLRRGDGAARALGMPVEPQGRRPCRHSRVRRHEDRAYLVCRRQDRLSHAAHAVSDLDQVSVDQAFRRAFLLRPDRRGRPLPGRAGDRRSAPASSR